MWAIMMNSAPFSMAFLKGIKSHESSSAFVRLIMGRALWESTAVSPWPGKCLKVAVTPFCSKPSARAWDILATMFGSSEKLRRPMTGLLGFEKTSASGAISTLTPTTRSSSARILPMALAWFRSPVSPTEYMSGMSVGLWSVMLCKRWTRPPSSSVVIMSGVLVVDWRVSVRLLVPARVL